MWLSTLLNNCLTLVPPTVGEFPIYGKFSVSGLDFRPQRHRLADLKVPEYWSFIWFVWSKANNSLAGLSVLLIPNAIIPYCAVCIRAHPHQHATLYKVALCDFVTSRDDTLYMMHFNYHVLLLHVAYYSEWISEPDNLGKGKWHSGV